MRDGKRNKVLNGSSLHCCHGTSINNELEPTALYTVPLPVPRGFSEDTLGYKDT